MDYVFWYCVELLKLLANMSGLTYQEINVWLFVIIHPLITMLFFILWIRSKCRH